MPQDTTLRATGLFSRGHLQAKAIDGLEVLSLGPNPLLVYIELPDTNGADSYRGAAKDAVLVGVTPVSAGFLPWYAGNALETDG